MHQRFLVREYLRKDGSSPIREWLESLQTTTQARIAARLTRFEAGNLGDCKPVGSGVWEARFMFGSGYRLYFGRKGNSLILLLTGGDKGSQQADIASAKKYWEEFLEVTHE